MCNMISCLIARNGKVYAKDGIHSHSQLAEFFGIDQDKHLPYEFRLDTRTLKQDFGMNDAPFIAKVSHDQAARRFFDECAGTPEKLLAYVQRGNWQHHITRLLIEDLNFENKHAKLYDKSELALDRLCDKKSKEEKRVEDFESLIESKLEIVESELMSVIIDLDASDSVTGKLKKNINSIDSKLSKVFGELKQLNSELRDKRKEVIYQDTEEEDKIEQEYTDACIKAWCRLFKKPENRIPIWR